MNKICIFFIFISSWMFSQSTIINPEYRNDTIASTILNEKRIINIALPADFSVNKKYPVIYVLDGEALFETVAAETKHLSDFNVIPKCIVVAIPNTNRNSDLSLNWNTGKYTDESLLFSRFINAELTEYINKSYPASGFNVIIGHSNGAGFIHNLFTGKNNFHGYIALSQSLFGEQQQNFAQAIQKQEANNYYFVASGTRDSQERLQSGKIMDSIYKKSTSNLRFEHKIYDANHEGVFIRGLNPGLSFIFSDYHHLSYNESLIDELIAKKTDPVNYIKNYILKIKKIYGIEMAPDVYDFDFGASLLTNEEQLLAFQKYQLQHIPFNANTFYAEYAQHYEHIGNYEKALEYWKLNLEKGYNEHIFYYRRPFELLYKKMDKPKEAIAFAEKSIKTFPKGELIFNYFIAYVSAENKTEREKGLKAINFCINNYIENSAFTLDEAKERKRILEQ